MIKAYSDEHIYLFSRAIDEFAKKIEDRKVVIHKAFYAEGDWEYKDMNKVLSLFYDLSIKALRPWAVVEVVEGLRVASPGHKWGLAPFHYQDDYYKDFIRQFTEKIGMEILVRSNFSMQKAS